MTDNKPSNHKNAHDVTGIITQAFNNGDISTQSLVGSTETIGTEKITQYCNNECEEATIQENNCKEINNPTLSEQIGETGIQSNELSHYLNYKENKIKNLISLLEKERNENISLVKRMDKVISDKTHLEGRLSYYESEIPLLRCFAHLTKKCEDQRDELSKLRNAIIELESDIRYTESKEEYYKEGLEIIHNLIKNYLKAT
jgi:hypothetical protein